MNLPVVNAAVIGVDIALLKLTTVYESVLIITIFQLTSYASRIDLGLSDAGVCIKSESNFSSISFVFVGARFCRRRYPDASLQLPGMVRPLLAVSDVLFSGYGQSQ